MPVVRVGLKERVYDTIVWKIEVDSVLSANPVAPSSASTTF